MLSAVWTSLAFAGPCSLGVEGSDGWVTEALLASDALVEQRAKMSSADAAAVVGVVESGPPLTVRTGVWDPPRSAPDLGVERAVIVDPRGMASWGPPFSGASSSRQGLGPSVVVSVDLFGDGPVDLQAVTERTGAGTRLLRHRALAVWPMRRNVGLLWPDSVPAAAAAVAGGASLTEALRRSLGADSVLLVASRSGDGVGVCALTRDGEVFGTTPAAPWERLAKPDSARAIAMRGLEARQTEEPSDVPTELPLPAEVAAVVARHKRVLVFGPGSLVRAPYLALPLAGASTPMVETHTVEIVSSLGELLVPERRWARPRRATVVAVANAPASTGLPPIPGAIEEATQVAARFRQPRLLADRDAGRVAVTSALRLGEGVLHIAAHGSSSSEEPVQGSGVWLTGDDPLLDVADIMDMDLSRYGLVVLSACDTGTGKDLEGGVISLARGFLIAGAPIVIASRKPIGDATTVSLMNGFYQHLMNDADRPAPAEALRRAMSAQRAARPHDFGWSDFYVFRR